MVKLTYQQKLDALSYRFYQNGQWTPKAGDFYTTSRADLELYQVVSVEGGFVRTRFTEGSDVISEWLEAGFLTEGFGPRRVFVPEWVMNAGGVQRHDAVLECLKDARKLLSDQSAIDLHYIDAVIANAERRTPSPPERARVSDPLTSTGGDAP